MIDWREAQARVVALGSPVTVERTSLSSAIGAYAAEPLHARRSQPAKDLSAMDGYAIRFDDLPGPWTVVGESAAGAPMRKRIWPGEAARIFTGAFLPVGSDTVVIQEEVVRIEDHIELSGNGPSGLGGNVRRKASDFREGDTLIETGDRITSARIALGVTGGHDMVESRRPVRICIASTGDELVHAGNALDEGQLPDSNGPMLTAMLAGLPVELFLAGPVPDHRAELRDLFDAAQEFDILVTSGGASVGDHDLVRPVLLDLGATLDFWKVAMRPGKPLMAGRLGDTVVLGLPGNPVSAFVTATLFLLPLVRHMSGARDPFPRLLPATVAADMPAVGPRTDFVRARWVERALAPLPSSDSGVLSSLAKADALIVRAAGAEPLAAGQAVEAILLA